MGDAGASALTTYGSTFVISASASRRRAPYVFFIFLCYLCELQLLLVHCGALNCALPEPFLLGVQNATAVALPVDIMLTNSRRTDDAYFVVAMHNGRDMAWHQHVYIDKPGRHRFIAVTLSLTSNCSRTDFFIFDGYLLPSSAKDTVQPVGRACLQPELHQVILWSSVAEDAVTKYYRLLQALSEVSTYLDAKYSLLLHKVVQADPGPKHRFKEQWYEAFYGDTYYGIYFNSPAKVDMVEVKGDGAFYIIMLEDVCPKYVYDLERRMLLNVNMMNIKKLLRHHNARWYQVHATLNLRESDFDYEYLFGVSAEDFRQTLHRTSVHQPDGSHFPLVDRAMYVMDWRRIFLPSTAMEVLSVVMQSEWYRYKSDHPELHAEMTTRISEPNIYSDMENILRAAFLSASRLALLAHLPADIEWYKGTIPLHHVYTFRILNENGWHLELRPCSTISEAVVLLSTQEQQKSDNLTTFPVNNGDHSNRIAQLTQRIAHFNHTIVAVGASLGGPFTIWDGNHRAIALASTQAEDSPLSIYIGISPRFHSPHRGSFYCP